MNVNICGKLFFRSSLNDWLKNSTKRWAQQYPSTARRKHGQYILLEKCISARELARRLNLHHSTIQRYVKGLHMPDPRIMARMAALLGGGKF